MVAYCKQVYYFCAFDLTEVVRPTGYSLTIFLKTLLTLCTCVCVCVCMCTRMHVYMCAWCMCECVCVCVCVWLKSNNYTGTTHHTKINSKIMLGTNSFEQCCYIFHSIYKYILLRLSIFSLEEMIWMVLHRDVLGVKSWMIHGQRVCTYVPDAEFLWKWLESFMNVMFVCLKKYCDIKDND